MRRTGGAPRPVGQDDDTTGVEGAYFSGKCVERAEYEAIRIVLRPLRLGQQMGATPVAVHDGVDLARIERLELCGARDQAAKPGLERRLSLVWREHRVGGTRCVDHVDACFTPSAARTSLVSLRLPTRWAPGDGDSLARLGVTRMPASSARRGCSQTSTISSS